MKVKYVITQPGFAIRGEKTVSSTSKGASTLPRVADTLRFSTSDDGQAVTVEAMIVKVVRDFEDDDFEVHAAFAHGEQYGAQALRDYEFIIKEG